MKKFSKTIQLCILFALLMAVSFSFCYLFFQKIQSQNEQVAIINRKIDSDLAAQAHLVSLRASLADTESSRQMLDALILNANGFVPFVESVEQLAKSQGVTITDTLGTAPDSNSTINTEFLVLQITLSGDWNSITRAISLIETMPYVLSIDNLTLNKNLSMSNAKKSLWDVSFTLRIMKYKT